MLIVGDRTYLGLMEPADAPEVQKWMNEIELRRLCWTECPLPVDLEGARCWIKEMNEEPQTRLLSIRRLAEGDLIGFFTLRKLSWVSRSVRFGSLIWPPSLWNQGIGTDARRAVLAYAFGQLGLRRVYGSFGAFNIASLRSHEKLGAEVTVNMREAVYFDGVFHDSHGYVYRRERFPGFAETKAEGTSPVPPRWTPATVAGSIDRAYLDYYGCPIQGDTARRRWLRDKHVHAAGTGDIVLMVEKIRQNAEMLLFPRRRSRLAPGLIRAAVHHCFNDLNLHRIQACLPLQDPYFNHVAYQERW